MSSFVYLRPSESVCACLGYLLVGYSSWVPEIPFAIFFAGCVFIGPIIVIFAAVLYLSGVLAAGLTLGMFGPLARFGLVYFWAAFIGWQYAWLALSFSFAVGVLIGWHGGSFVGIAI